MCFFVIPVEGLEKNKSERKITQINNEQYFTIMSKVHKPPDQINFSLLFAKQTMAFSRGKIPQLI